MPPRRRKRRQRPRLPTGPRPIFNAILKSTRCPRCDSPFKTTAPSGRIGHHDWDCTCGGTIIVSFDEGAWCWYFHQGFIAQGREWRLEYRSYDKSTEFMSCEQPRDENADLETHVLPGFVSHERFAKLIPFL